ncbi:hypothetical protein HYV74_03495 [Candidatus Uhrbacteria bacterium]|nr:hypothetical protein [Candidatus Uhrbacteria bacterium]
MSESGDYQQSSYWSGHDFGDAYARYDQHAGRSYAQAQSAGVTIQDLVPKRISTQSTRPLLIRIDHTGSMHEAPKKIFEKLPYLSHEARQYLGDDTELSVGAIGDMSNGQVAGEGDRYPLQIRDFAQLSVPQAGAKTKRKTAQWEDPEIAKRLLELVIEGGGGGQMHENYEFAMLYDARNVDMPRAITPVAIYIGDEMPYEVLAPEYAEHYGHLALERSMTIQEVVAELQQKYSVYFIQLPYSGHVDGDQMTADTKTVHRTWANLLGEDQVKYLPDPARVVDLIFGILAQETGRDAYFRQEIEARQTPAQVRTVYKALGTTHKLPSGKEPRGLRSGKSTLHRPSSGKKTKGLLDD